VSRIDWPAVHAAAAFWLAVPRTPLGGRAGERLGAGTGSSLEFQDHRQYAPGDDLRHVDWAAYARLDVLNVRLYREEVAPRVDLLLDRSRSMVVTDVKARAYANLQGLLAHACLRTGDDTRVIAADGPPHPLSRAEDVERAGSCDASVSALEVAHVPFRRRSLRVVVSDFLFPHDAELLVRRLARDGAWLALVQLTGPGEADPVVEPGLRLVDVEGHGEMDLVLDEEAVAGYRARFGRLRSALATACRRAGARFVHVTAERSVREAARELAAAGVLEPA